MRRGLAVGETQARCVAIDHGTCVAARAGLDSFQKLVSQQVSVSCKVVQSDKAYSLGEHLTPCHTRLTPCHTR
jgi:hypothetical protein